MAGSLTESGGANIVFSAAGTLNIAGDHNYVSGAFTAGTSTVTHNGATNQSVGAVSYNNLTINKTSGLAFINNAMSVLGNLLIASGELDNFSTTTISGNVTINSGSIFENNNVIYVGGNWTNGLNTITSTGFVTAGGGRTFTFNGDIVNRGVYSMAGTVIFGGTSLQTISAIDATIFVGTINFNGAVSPVFNSTSAPQFGNLTINNTGGIYPNVGWTIFNALTIGSGASFNGGTTTHNFLGAVTNNGTITSNGTLNFVPSSTATVDLGSDFSSTDRVYFGGAGAMTLLGTPVSFRNVNITNTNAAGITPSSNWNISNDFTVNSGSILNAGNYNYAVGGNLSNSGTINSATSTFTLNGSGAQDIYSASAFKNLSLNKASGTATLSSNATVNGVLSFVAGKLQTGGNTLIEPSSGTVTGASQNTGWVNGNLQKNIATGATSKTFEVGGPNNYRPVTVAFASVSTAGDLFAGVTSGDHVNIGTSTINAAQSVNQIWTLANSGIVFMNYGATFSFVTGDIDAGASTAAFIVGKYSGGSWTHPTVGTKTSTSTQATGLTAFGDFQMGATASIPNVTLTASVSPTGFVRPRTDLVYTISFVNNGVGSAFAFVITDPIPANTDFKLGSVTTSLGTTGLTPTVAYSNNGGITWTYTPASAAGGAPAGYDRNVTHVRWSFGASLSQISPDNAGSVTLTTRIR